jgi:hypothetical protein
MDKDEVETHDPTIDTDSNDDVQDSLDTANVDEGQNDELASYEDQVAALLRGEEPESDAAEVDEESEGISGENTESEIQAVAEEDEPENEKQNADEEVDDLPSRFRVRTDDPVEKFAMDLRKRNPDLSLKECLERADAQLNPSQEEGEEITSSVVDQLETEIEELSVQHSKHLKEFETEEAEEVAQKLILLNKELRKAEREDITQMLTQTISDNQRQQQHSNAIDNSADAAVQAYPELDDTNSSLHKTAIMYDTAQSAKDPDYANSPNRPFIAAREAAKLLGIGASDHQQQSTTTSQRPVIPAARGNAKTQRPQQATNRIDEALDNISSTDEYEALIEKLNA